MAETTDPRGRAYHGQRVTVYYDIRRCTHFAECVRGLPDVFDVHKRPWVQPDNGSAELVAAVIRRCPTGALHYELADGPPEAPERPTRVEAVPDGPLTIRGDLRIEAPAGEIYDVRAALCRCGRTQNQPFCDQQCTSTGWSSAASRTGTPRP